MKDKKKEAMEALLDAVKDSAEKATKATAAESMHHTQAALNAVNAYMGLATK